MKHCWLSALVGFTMVNTLRARSRLLVSHMFEVDWAYAGAAAHPSNSRASLVPILIKPPVGGGSVLDRRGWKKTAAPGHIITTCPYGEGFWKWSVRTNRRTDMTV